MVEGGWGLEQGLIGVRNVVSAKVLGQGGPSSWQREGCTVAVVSSWPVCLVSSLLVNE